MRLVQTLALSLLLGCAGSPKATTTAPTAPTADAPAKKGLQIKLITVYVDDQEKALRFYTDVLGFQKKDDFSNEGFRWLSVTHCNARWQPTRCGRWTSSLTAQPKGAASRT